jgi:hypothetical protein
VKDWVSIQQRQVDRSVNQYFSQGFPENSQDRLYEGWLEVFPPL